jgi:aryl-alcohol dehydrogenase-like predicted oxidoreductase
MDKRIIGSNNLQMSKIGLGCMGLSECYGKTNDAESIKTIHKAFDLGVNHFDTADYYGAGHNEQLLGKAVAEFRHKIILASKVGLIRDKQHGEYRGVDGSPQHLKKACEASLKRLKTDYLDLLYLHRVDLDTPIEVSMAALSDLVKEGKILNIGLSEVCAETIARANQVHQLTAIQSEYSLWCREPEEKVIPLCRALKIGFVAHGPLGKGFLTGTIQSVHSLSEDDLRRSLPRFQDENITHNLTIISVLQEMAQSKGCTLPQLALAWVLAQGDDIVAISGTKTVSHLEENLKAANVQLSKKELEEITHRIPKNFPQGDLLPESLAKLSNR